MDDTTIPESAQNTSDNFAGFSNRRSVTPDQFFASIDLTDNHHLQVEQCLLDHPLVTAGMLKTLAAIKSIGSGLGHISMTPRVRGLLCKVTRQEPDTIRKHIATLTRLTLTLRYIKLSGEEIVIPAGPHKIQREIAYRHLEKQTHDDLAKQEALDRRRAADRARKAAARAARAAMSKQRDNPPPSFSSSLASACQPNSRHAEANSAARPCQEFGMDVPWPQAEVHLSYTNADTNVDKTITPPPTSAEGVGDCEDTAQTVSVVVPKTDVENLEQNSLEEPLDDPFDGDDVLLSNSASTSRVAPFGSARPLKTVRGDDSLVVVAAAARLENEIGLALSATGRLVAEWRELGDSDAFIAQVLMDALDITLTKMAATKVGSPQGLATNTARNMASSRRAENTSTQRTYTDRQFHKNEVLRAAAGDEDVQNIFARYKFLWASDKPQWDAVEKAAQNLASESVPGWLGMGIVQRRESLSLYVLMAFKVYEAQKAEPGA